MIDFNISSGEGEICDVETGIVPEGMHLLAVF